MNSQFDNHFPKTSHAVENWKPYVRYSALHMRVLTVATTRIEGAWIAYIGNVPGMNHHNEFEEVLDWGISLREDIARILYPEFEGVPYVK